MGLDKESAAPTPEKIYASPARIELRVRQQHLNALLWGSELAYEIVLSGPLSTVEKSAWVYDELAHVDTHAWHPGVNLKPHYDRRVREYLEDLRRAKRDVAIAVLTAWFGHFERYLSRVLLAGKETEQGWGALVHLNRQTRLRETAHQLRFETVLTADVWREVRNVCVHRPHFKVAGNRSRDKIQRSLERSYTAARNKGWQLASEIPDGASIGDLVAEAVGDAIGGAARMARKPGSPCLEVFCAIFAFGAIDNLVHEIEEATVDPPTRHQVLLRNTLELRNRELVCC
jgi:hypothetical protein